VQSYLEQGPLGMLGMLLLPALVIVAALIARRDGLLPGHRPLIVAGLGLVGGTEAHGLTDQVVTTNIGTLLLVLGSAAVFASLSRPALARITAVTLRLSALIVCGVLLLALAALAMPVGRAQLLLNLGGLKMNAALSVPTQSPERASALADAESVLSMALDQDPSHPAIQRDLAWVRSARYDDSGALTALNAAVQSPRIDAFDMLQIAHVYRDMGATDEAYTWATRAYGIWGRSEEDAVMGTYAQATLSDPRARTLADQAEAAMRARHFGDAHGLFEQALTFEASSAYLESRIGASQRAIDKYGP
jgi:tetratricopeptide (TPR) repeat protein